MEKSIIGTQQQINFVSKQQFFITFLIKNAIQVIHSMAYVLLNNKSHTERSLL
jgi:hypothetical protein